MGRWRFWAILDERPVSAFFKITATNTTPTPYAPRVAPAIQCHPPGLAAWSRPEFVIISGDEDRRGAVRAAYEAVGASLLETTQVGAVTFDVVRDGRLQGTTFRDPHVR